MFKKIFLFTIPFLICFSAVIIYFVLTQKVVSVSLPKLPSVSFSDLVKLSRFSLEKAPSMSLVGSITSMTGEVLYEPRLATESAKINSPVNVQQGDSLKTGAAGSFILNFKDALEVNVEPSSGLNVIQTLPADLVFQQTLGAVTYRKLGTLPVSIRVGHLLVENMGEIKISFTADSPVTTLTMINGSATVAYNNLENTSHVVTVDTGQILKFNEGNRKVELK